MGDTLFAAKTSFDAGQWTRQGVEVRQLATRMARCADEADAALSQLGQAQMRQWQSPAGRAYRNVVASHLTELRRARDTLREASALVMQEAATAAVAAGQGY
ncbi:hypothetical protein [Arthrobacter silvisoli]|uniref:hypothetical protein n=1 Tax=Arthrobacter silvisoli TaxID=2291022 RepID=UPI000E217339|nr:hypothetical protein [Arthrobacter silvisoli]